MNRVRIYNHQPSSTQSGAARDKAWVLSFEQGDQRTHDPLMGWISSGDTQSQVTLWFASREEAVAYAERRGWTYRGRAAAPEADPAQGLCGQFQVRPVGELDALTGPGSRP